MNDVKINMELKFKSDHWQLFIDLADKHNLLIEDVVSNLINQVMSDSYDSIKKENNL